MKQGKFRHFLQIIWINSRGFTEKTEGYFLERLVKETCGFAIFELVVVAEKRRGKA